MQNSRRFFTAVESTGIFAIFLLYGQLAHARSYSRFENISSYSSDFLVPRFGSRVTIHALRRGKNQHFPFQGKITSNQALLHVRTYRSKRKRHAVTKPTSILKWKLHFTFYFFHIPKNEKYFLEPSLLLTTSLYDRCTQEGEREGHLGSQKGLHCGFLKASIQREKRGKGLKEPSRHHGSSHKKEKIFFPCLLSDPFFGGCVCCFLPF